MPAAPKRGSGTLSHIEGNRNDTDRVKNGKMALITGASSGFGLLTALTLAARGWRVVATMRDLGRSVELERRAEEAGLLKAIDCRRLDVTDEEAVRSVVAQAVLDYGAIDLLVNNAGYALGGYVEDVPLQEWRNQLDTNFFGTVAVTRAALPAMRERGRGMIINIGSVSGRAAFPGYGPYAASKFALEGFSESLRHELAPFGVKVVILEPGSYRTSIWEKGLAGIIRPEHSAYSRQLDAVLKYSGKSAQTAPDPQEVADLVAKVADMASPRLRYTLGQGSRLLLWGRALLPWKWFERIVAAALKG